MQNPCSSKSNHSYLIKYLNCVSASNIQQILSHLISQPFVCVLPLFPHSPFRLLHLSSSSLPLPALPPSPSQCQLASSDPVWPELQSVPIWIGNSWCRHWKTSAITAAAVYCLSSLPVWLRDIFIMILALFLQFFYGSTFIYFCMFFIFNNASFSIFVPQWLRRSRGESLNFLCHSGNVEKLQNKMHRGK